MVTYEHCKNGVKKSSNYSEGGDLKCSLCDQLFKFRSKYSRHLESSHHTGFQQSLDVYVIWMMLMVQAQVQERAKCCYKLSLFNTKIMTG